MATRLSPPQVLADWPLGEGLGTPWPIRLVAALTFINGLFTLLDVLYNRFSGRLEALLPFDYDYLRSFGLLAGFLLIYFAAQLLRRKRVAWLIVTIASGLIIIVHTLYIREPTALLLPVVSLALLIVYRDLFYARSEPANIAQGLRLFGLSLGVAIGYGVIGFLLLLHRDFRQDFTLPQAIWQTLQQFVLLGGSSLIPHTRYALWFLDSIDLLGILSVGFLLVSLFRPLAYRYRTLPQDRLRARELLEQYGNSSEDAFKLWPEDKSYYFSGDGQSFLAYKVVGGVAFALGDVTGPARMHKTALRDFSQYCRRYGWSPCYLYVTERQRAAGRQLGLRSFKIGEDAVVNLQYFTAETQHSKYFRQITNRYARLGYTAEWLESPQAAAVLAQIESVSHSWLQLPGRVERGFALGYFDRRYLASSPLFVVRDAQGQIEAFANLIHSYDAQEANIDLFRHRADGAGNIMDFLFIGLIAALKERGFTSLNLGLAPFSGLVDQGDRSLEEWFIHLLYRGQFKPLRFQGLRRYKEKFEPAWRSRYIVYEGGPAELARIGLAINRLVEAPGLR